VFLELSITYQIKSHSLLAVVAASAVSFWGVGRRQWRYKRMFTLTLMMNVSLLSILLSKLF
jgi:hypothetical protein